MDWFERRAGFEPAIVRLCRPLPWAARAPTHEQRNVVAFYLTAKEREQHILADSERMTGLEPATSTLARLRSTN